MPPADSRPVESSFTFLPQGAIIQEFRVGGRNIVQGFPVAGLYVTHNTPYFGETIGRTTNRIKDGILSDLNGGKEYQLPINNGPNSLHGGRRGWGKRMFEGPRRVERYGRHCLEFRYRSKNGEEGYPGAVDFTVWYSATREKGERTVLSVEYEVQLVDDEVAETVVGVTNHRWAWKLLCSFSHLQCCHTNVFLAQTSAAYLSACISTTAGLVTRCRC